MGLQLNSMKLKILSNINSIMQQYFSVQYKFYFLYLPTKCAFKSEPCSTPCLPAVFTYLPVLSAHVSGKTPMGGSRLLGLSLRHILPTVHLDLVSELPIWPRSNFLMSNI